MCSILELQLWNAYRYSERENKDQAIYNSVLNLTATSNLHHPEQSLQISLNICLLTALKLITFGCQCYLDLEPSILRSPRQVCKKWGISYKNQLC